MRPIASAWPIAASMEGTLPELADFDAVVRLYWPRVFRFALASLRDRDAAQTVAQDCFLKAYRARASFRGEARLLTWLLKIAMNLIRDYSRRSFRPHAGDSDAVLNWTPASGIDPERRVLVKEQVETLWKVTASLPERQRTVFLLRYVEEMELLEIAAATGLKENAVKVHLYRALRSVRKQVGRLR
jgi:RNA polymerase sigma-70 factor, ECF subfamily